MLIPGREAEEEINNTQKVTDAEALS